MTGDRIFQIVSIASLVVAVAGSGVHFLAVARKRRRLAPPLGPADLPRYSRIERYLFVLTVLVFLALAVTGMAPGVLWAGRLEGYLLMMHVGSGGAFMALLALLALRWAEDCRFKSHDARWWQGCCGGEEPLPAGRFDAGQKLAFWAVLALGTVTILTMMVSMLPVFGPEGLETLRDVHRYCGLVFVLIAYLHCYRTMTARQGRWSWLLSGKVNSDWARHYHPLWWQVVKGEEGS